MSSQNRLTRIPFKVVEAVRTRTVRKKIRKIPYKILEAITERSDFWAKERIENYLEQGQYYIDCGNTEEAIAGRSQDHAMDHELDLYREQSAQLRRFLDDLTGKTVVDLGSGDLIGHAIYFLTKEKIAKFFLVELYVTRSFLEKRKEYYLEKEEVKEEDLEGKIELIQSSVEQVPLPDESMDIVLSKSLFEHLKPKAVKRCIGEIERMLKPGGIAVIQIDLKDHHDFERPFDFYAIPEWLWRFLTINPIHYANRMRYTEFVALFEKRKKLEILDVATEEVSKPLPPLARKFRKFSETELTTVLVTLTLRKAGF